MSRSILAIVLGLGALDAIAWAAYRLDKARARRERRRISERALLVMTALGGFGAVLGMYGHRDRHKTRKAIFVVAAAAAALARLALIIGGAYLLATRARG